MTYKELSASFNNLYQAFNDFRIENNKQIEKYSEEADIKKHEKKLYELNRFIKAFTGCYFESELGNALNQVIPLNDYSHEQGAKYVILESAVKEICNSEHGSCDISVEVLKKIRNQFDNNVTDIVRFLDSKLDVNKYPSRDKYEEAWYAAFEEFKENILENIKKDVVEIYGGISEVMSKENNKDEKVEFVTISLSRKQIDFDNVMESEKNKKDYVRIIGPDGGAYFYPLESIKQSKDNEDRFYYSRPKGTEIYVKYSERIEGVPDNAPKSEKYKNRTEIIKIEDLKDMYDAAKKKFLEEKNKENDTHKPASKEENKAEQKAIIEVSEKLIHHFESKGKGYVSVSVPVFDKEKNQGVFFNVVMPEYRLSDSQKNGMVIITVPEEYEFNAKRSVKNTSGEYEDIVIKLTGAEIKKHFEKSKERYSKYAEEQKAQNESKEDEKQQNNVAPQQQHRPRRGR